MHHFIPTFSEVVQQLSSRCHCVFENPFSDFSVSKLYTPDNKRNAKKRSTKSKQILKDLHYYTFIIDTKTNVSKSHRTKKEKIGQKLKPANATEISFVLKAFMSQQSLKDQNHELRKSVASISFDINETLSHLSHHKANTSRCIDRIKNDIIPNRNEPKIFRNILHQNLVQIVSILTMLRS